MNFINKTFMCCAIFSAAVFSQQSPHDVAGRIASFLQTETKNQIVHRKTKNIITELDPSAVDTNIQFASLFNDWNYPNGVMLYGMLACGKSEYVISNFDFLFHNKEYFKKMWNQFHWNRIGTEYELHRMESLDDCGAMGVALIEAYRLAGNKQWRETIDTIANYIHTKQTRLTDGTLCRTVPRKMTIWGDDLYMSVPFLARMSTLTHDTVYYSDAIHQVLEFYRLLTDPQKKIMHHGYYTDSSQQTFACWGRVNGWMLVAATELLSQLPAQCAGRDRVVQCVQSHIRGLVAYQDSSTGLWHQVLDRPESYLETSCSAMFVYSIASGIQNGWQDAAFAAFAKKGWQGVASRVTSEGHILGTCAGTSIGNDFQFYYSRPSPENDLHAFGPVLLAASAMMKLSQ
ncbi:MAG: glycoside hydrolase family 88 protein [Bacteroidota bacterium]